MRRLAPAIGFLVAALGCASAAPAAPDPPPPEPSPEISLHIGEKAHLRGGIVVAFIGVMQDSRCPKGVQCISAGRAVVRLEATPRGGDPVTLELDTARESEAEVGSHSVTLLGLDPVPVADRPISPAEYLLRLSVR